MASHFRKNTIHNESLDEEQVKASLRKKQVYKSMLLDQIKEQQCRKLKEKEEARRLDREYEEIVIRQFGETSRRIQQGGRGGQQNRKPTSSQTNSTEHNKPPIALKHRFGNISSKQFNRSQKDEITNLPLRERDMNAHFHSYSPLPTKIPPPPLNTSKREDVDFEDYINSKIEKWQSLSSANQHFINTSLSKNYIMKYKEVDDYNTLIDNEIPFKHRLQFSKNSQFTASSSPIPKTPENSQVDTEINKMKLELKKLTEQAIKASTERDVKHLEFLKLQNDFQRLHVREIQKQRSLKTALLKAGTVKEEESLLKTYLDAINTGRSDPISKLVIEDKGLNAQSKSHKLHWEKDIPQCKTEKHNQERSATEAILPSPSISLFRRSRSHASFNQSANFLRIFSQKPRSKL
jgi:hypothetical protein